MGGYLIYAQCAYTCRDLRRETLATFLIDAHRMNTISLFATPVFSIARASYRRAGAMAIRPKNLPRTAPDIGQW
jgi:hypothetical protein